MTEQTYHSLKIRKPPSTCDNCHRERKLDYYHYVLKGIYLCENCADLPVSAVARNKYARDKYAKQ